MQPPIQDQGLPISSLDRDPQAPLQESEVPFRLDNDRSADEFEAHSIKWNVARVVRLSSGRYALLTHYRAGALDIIKVGTIEEIAPHIPTVEQCIPESVHRPARTEAKLDLNDLLANIGLT